ncbi:nuclease-related domain-containing protein [Bacillus marinisedimentorum]|uniref:nuclease-related domain-containing protein n=1 Tax=Bacillus marinisedimentorum TaxID=1821260 RepID=UPI000871DE65|nr:nuclease-related domain-containing protein [Bacillus marinisedimentorum]
MIVKPRNEPDELLRLRYLDKRAHLTPREQKYLLNLEKGLEGEEQFDRWAQEVTECLILNDLVLELNNTVAQIDSLFILNNTIFLFEVKNYEGDFYIQEDRWYTISNSEIKNPIHQLKRAESLLKLILHELGYTFSLKSYIIFINPNFHLYQAPLNLPVIFPGQLKRTIIEFNEKSKKTTIKHTKLSEKLLSLHLKSPTYKQISDYSDKTIATGLMCMSCNAFFTQKDVSRKFIKCSVCGRKEKLDKAILRTVREFEVLFPDCKLTTKTIHEWCGTITSTRPIRRVLNSNYKMIRQSNGTFYV